MANFILQNITTTHNQARLFSIALLAVFMLGIATAFGLLIAAMWLIAEIMITAIETVLSGLEAIGNLYSSQNSFIQLLLLACAAFIAWHAAKRIRAWR